MGKIINNLDDLTIPEKHKKFLEIFLSNIKNIQSIQRVILFGSCARGEATAKSDIDILVIGSHITKNDENLRAVIVDARNIV